MESVTEILVYFSNTSTGVIDSTWLYHVKASRYFVCDQTVCGNQNI